MILGLDRRHALILGLSLAIVVAIIWYFHDRFWWPMDAGVYAYVAQRILAGDVIHRDLVDLHAGLGNFINAGAFALFGEDLLSLRYPLAVLSVVQSALAYWILKDKGALVAGLAAILVASTGFIQFPIAGAQWYALFLAFLTIYLAGRLDIHRARDLIILGVLIGACFLIRQLSGVMLAMGVITWLLFNWRSSGRSSDPSSPAISGKILAGIIVAGIVIYLISKMSITAFFGAGVWALIIGFIALRRVDLSLQELAPRIGFMLIGCGLIAMPMTVYFLANGALFDWLRDVLITPFLIHGQDFIREISYGGMFIASVMFLFAFAGVDTTFSVFGWLAALLILPGTGFLCARYIEKLDYGQVVHPLPVISAFWAILTMHYQIPHYFFSAFPVVVCALLFLTDRRWVQIVCALLAVWALWYQAAQPVSRMLRGDIIGLRTTYAERSELPKVSLRIEPVDDVIFSEIITRIESEAGPNEPVLTFPGEPIINFMTERPVPGWFYMVPTGVPDEAALERALDMMRREAPFFVVDRYDSKSHNHISEALLAETQAWSEEPVRIGDFDLYRYLGPPGPEPRDE